MVKRPRNRVLMVPIGSYAILDLGVHSYRILDVSKRFRLYLSEVSNLKTWRILMFDRELTLRLSHYYWYFWTVDRFI